LTHPSRLLALLALLLAAGLAHPAAARPANPQSQALDQAIQAEMEKSAIPGLSLAILQDGKIVRAQGYGVAVKDAKARVTPDTLFQAGSVSKSVTALGALCLVQQGRLSLDEDVNRYLTAGRCRRTTSPGRSPSPSAASSATPPG
jgi:CubicO group peptidase (beta-lactamase class C family)